MFNRILKIVPLALTVDVVLLTASAIAGVPSGQPRLVPEPISTSLFLTGAATIGIVKFMNRKKNSKRSK